MITSKTVTTYGFISLAAMVAMLGLIWFKQVPESLYLTMFLVAVALFLVRVTLRLVLRRQERLRKAEQASRSQSDQPPAAITGQK